MVGSVPASAASPGCGASLSHILNSFLLYSAWSLYGKLRISSTQLKGLTSPTCIHTSRPKHKMKFWKCDPTCSHSQNMIAVLHFQICSLSTLVCPVRDRMSPDNSLNLQNNPRNYHHHHHHFHFTHESTEVSRV